MATFTENCISSYIKLCKHYSEMADYDAEFDSAMGGCNVDIGRDDFRRLVEQTSMVPAALRSGWVDCPSLAEFIGEDESFPYGPSWATMDLIDPNATDESVKWFATTLPADDVWGMLKKCRVYCIDPEIYSKVYEKCMNSVFSEVYGFDHTSNFFVTPNKSDDGGTAIVCNSGMGKEDLKDLADKFNSSNIDLTFQKLAKNIPFMPNVPFDSIYLAYGDCIPLDALQNRMRDKVFSATGEFTGSNKKLKGHMILPGGWVYEHIACDFTDNFTDRDPVSVSERNFYLSRKRDLIMKDFDIDDRELATRLAEVGLDHQMSSMRRYYYDTELPYSLLVRHGEGTPFLPSWPGACTLAPWTLTAIFELISENSKSIVIQSGRSHTGLADTKPKSRAVALPNKKKKNKHHQKNLAPFYVINLTPSVVESGLSDRVQRVADEGSGRSLQYRHDREGHERLLVKRGQLPLDLGVEAELLERGYDIWVEGQPDMYTRSKLVLKRHPMRQENEWLAIKTVQVSSTVVGDDSLPYRPAARHLSYGSVKDILDVSTV